MALFPEQQRALDYARRRGSEASAESIYSRVASTFQTLDELLESVDGARIRRPPGPGSWSVIEVADHLLESDRPAVEQLRDLIEGKSSDTPIPPSLQSKAPLDRDWQMLLHDLRAVHHDLLSLIEQAGDSAPLEATTPVEMVVKCTMADGTLQPVQWVERFDWKAFAILIHAHNREHIAQVERILNQISA